MRELARAERRDNRRARRLGLAATAAIGAGAAFAPAAQAADFTVNSLGDGPAGPCDADCTLRDAVEQADASAGADTITFASTLSGTITLTQGQLEVNGGPLTVSGPGADVLAVSGDANGDDQPNAGDSRVFSLAAAVEFALSGLTLTEGYDSGNAGGGAISFAYSASDVTVTDAILTDNRTFGSGGAINGGDGSSLVLDGTEVTDNGTVVGGGNPGGGIFMNDGTDLTVTDSTITGNDSGAASGGGVSAAARSGFKYSPEPEDAPQVSISGSTISRNSAGSGGGLSLSTAEAEILDSTISGNVASVDASKYGAGAGGGINASKYAALRIDGSTISGNEAGGLGGAVAFSGSPSGKYEGFNPQSVIVGSTISGNRADTGGGVSLAGTGEGQTFEIIDSTLSGNAATPDASSPASATGLGGGVAVLSGQAGALALTNSTISGNTAERGGGVSFGYSDGYSVTNPTGSVAVDNSTIASNRASEAGGGAYVGSYTDSAMNEVSPVIPLSSTIVGDNNVGPRNAASPNDLDRADGSIAGGFALDFSLAEAPSPDAIASQSESIVGEDPRLARLADNGGPTRTHDLRNSSPAIDAATANGLNTDQRGERRTVDLPPPNVGDGTDIGALELQELAVPETTITTGPSGPVRVDSATFSFRSDDRDATFECSLDGGPYEPCSSPKTYRDLENGPHTFSVRATSGGATDPTPATRSFRTAVAPETTIDSGPSGRIDRDRARFTFSSNAPDATFKCSIDGGPFRPCTSPMTYTDLSRGPHTFAVRAISGGAADQTPATRNFRVTVGERGPTTTITKAPKRKIETTKKRKRVGVRFRSEPGATFECKVDKKAFAPCDSPFKVKLKSKPGKGKRHTIVVRATDAAGNVESAPPELKVRVVRKPKR